MTKQETRTCRLCNEVKPLVLFEVDNRVKGGRTSRCRECKHGLDGRADRLYRTLKHRASKDGVPLEVTRRELQRLYYAFDGKCIYCDAVEVEDKLHHVDHIIPVKAGGRHTIENLVLSCPSCNGSKQDKPIIRFFIDKGLKKENLTNLVYYIALMTKQPVSEVVEEFAEQWQDFEEREEDS